MGHVGSLKYPDKNSERIQKKREKTKTIRTRGKTGGKKARKNYGSVSQNSNKGSSWLKWEANKNQLAPVN
jgi:hypothetical protein